MYSRKFGQGSVPPDYSGVSFRYPPPKEESCPEVEPCPVGTPRYPLETPCPRPKPQRKFTVKQSPKAPPKKVPEDKTEGLLSGHSFTMEDIVLAGLILLLLNSECDSELLLVLGFLLLVGL